MAKQFLASAEKVLLGLKQERAETQDMIKTFFGLLTQKLPRGRVPEDHEVEAAIEQLKDVHRMAGLLVVATLPGSVVTLPALIKLGRRFGVEVLPSAFKKVEDVEVIEEAFDLSAEQTRQIQEEHREATYKEDASRPKS